MKHLSLLFTLWAITTVTHNLTAMAPSAALTKAEINKAYQSIQANQNYLGRTVAPEIITLLNQHNAQELALHWAPEPETYSFKKGDTVLVCIEDSSCIYGKVAQDVIAPVFTNPLVMVYINNEKEIKQYRIMDDAQIIIRKIPSKKRVLRVARHVAQHGVVPALRQEKIIRLPDLRQTKPTIIQAAPAA